MICFVVSPFGWTACDPTPQCTDSQVLVNGNCIDQTEDVAPETTTEVKSEPTNTEKVVVGDEPPQGRDTPVEKAGEPKTEPLADAQEPPTRPEPPVRPEPPAPDVDVKEVIPEPSGPVPTVKITEPTDKAVVSDSITIKVDANVATGATIASVSLKIDGLDLHKWTQAPYEFPYSTLSLKDGKHTLTAIAITDLGQQAKQDIEINVANKGPEIKVVSPTASQGVSQSFTIEVNVTSTQGVKAGSVKLEVDGTPLAWTQTTPTYKATFDPKNLPFDSFPISISAEDTTGKKATEELWVIHEPSVGTKKAGEECDNTDPQKRCVKDHSCLQFGAATTPTCQANCVVGATPGTCGVVNGKQYVCQVAFQGTTRGVCAEGPPKPGQLYSACGNLNNQKCTTSADCSSPEQCVNGFCTVPCLNGLLCVGAQRRPDGRLISFCVKSCTTPNTACTGDPGFMCVGLQGGGGACIEQCGQACTADSQCSRGQTCKNKVCSTPFCPNYGACISITGLSSRVCI
jgi:hypothetical protein